MILVDHFLTVLFGTNVTLTVAYALISLLKPRNRKKLGSGDIRKLEIELPSFLDSMVSSLSVGNSLQQSMEMAAHKNQADIGNFFNAILLRVKTGLTLDASLELQARELAGGSLCLALLSMASSYRSGSNMIESLSLLATVCREREILRKKILARTAQSRTQGNVLIFVPVLFMLLLYVLSPQNMIPVLCTVTGRVLLGTAAILQCLGGMVIRAMLKQEIL